MWVYLARNETEKGKFDSAIEKCTYAITLDPNYSSAYSFRATPYIEQHKYKEAVDDVIKALSINDSDTRAQYHMIELADKAFDLLSAGLKAQQVRDGKNPLWSYNLGYFNAYKSRHAEAEQAFRKALAISQEEGVKYYLRILSMSRVNIRKLCNMRMRLLLRTLHMQWLIAIKQMLTIV